MANVLLCDWCLKEIVSEPQKVRFNNDNPMDCCLNCFREAKPKAKVGRPKKAKIVIDKDSAKSLGLEA